jgi:hypothetical protein
MKKILVFVALLLFAFASMAFAAPMTRYAFYSVEVTYRSNLTEIIPRSGEFTLDAANDNDFKAKLSQKLATFHKPESGMKSVKFISNTLSFMPQEFKTEKEYCDFFGLTHAQFIGQDKIALASTSGNMARFWVPTIIPDGFNPTTDDDLNLERLKVIPKGFSPTVGGSLNLQDVKIIPEGFSAKVGKFLNLNFVTTIQKGFKATVGEDLMIGDTLKSISEDFTPTVGGDLLARGVTSVAKGFKPTVGKSLILPAVTTIADDFNPSVKQNLDLSSFPRALKCKLAKISSLRA